MSTSTARAKAEESRPAGSLEENVFLNVVRTAAALEHVAAEGLKLAGLTLTQYNVLRILRGAGDDGLCRNEVGARMLTPVPDVTRLLDRLIDAGLVKKHRDTSDRRYVKARIRAEGLALLAKLDGPVAELHERQLGHMNPDELRQLADLLEVARRGR